MSMRASAARYARALLDVTTRESDPVAAEADLAAFVDLVRGNADLQRTFTNPAVSATAKRALVQQILDRVQTSAPVAKLLLLLAARGRLELQGVDRPLEHPRGGAAADRLLEGGEVGLVDLDDVPPPALQPLRPGVRGCGATRRN